MKPYNDPHNEEHLVINGKCHSTVDLSVEFGQRISMFLGPQLEAAKISAPYTWATELGYAAADIIMQYLWDLTHPAKEASD